MPIVECTKGPSTATTMITTVKDVPSNECIPIGLCDRFVIRIPSVQCTKGET